MAISTDATTNFSSATGYTLYNSGNVSFSGGVATLTSTDIKTAAIRTPQIDASGWQRLQKIVATLEQSLGFDIRFALSFSDWAGVLVKEFVVPLGGRFQVISTSDDSNNDVITSVLTKGITARDLELVRSWPDTITDISILVGLSRTATNGTGEIDLITYSYGTTELSFAGEGTASVSLTTPPDYGFSTNYEQYFDAVSFRENYVQNVELGTKLRRSISSIQWTLNDSDAATHYTFLKNAMSAPFNWTATGEATSRKWLVIGTPTVDVVSRGDGIRRVSARLLEVF
jgi:hypothetical protein